MNDILQSLSKRLLPLTLMLILAACGQKGPLRMPDDSDSHNQKPPGNLVEGSTALNTLELQRNLE